MQKYVVALEEAKLLKEVLPVGFKSEYIWIVTEEDTEHIYESVEEFKENYLMLKGRHAVIKNTYPALITDELLELLPREVTITSDHPLMENICPFKATLTMLSLEDGRYYFYSQNGNVWHGTTKTYNKAQMEHNKMMDGGSDEPINDATALSELYRWLKGDGLII